MKIQVNKHYIRADGDITFIDYYDGDVIYPFADARGFCYEADGTHSVDDITFDLICECNADILNSYMDKTITQKEFIQQHIEYWNKNESIIN